MKFEFGYGSRVTKDIIESFVGTFGTRGFEYASFSLGNYRFISIMSYVMTNLVKKEITEGIRS